MKSLVSSLILFLLFSCGNRPEYPDKISDNSIELYNSFDKENHLKPVFDKIRFDTLHEWDLGWALLESIDKAIDEQDEIKLSKRLSPGQKALYFYWYLNDEVTNGGFIQFYWNGYSKYMPPIKNGLKLIGDTAMLDLVEKADKKYLVYKDKFDLQKQQNDWSPLYENFKEFDIYDSLFYKIQNRPMELIEVYIRKHPEEFMEFK